MATLYVTETGVQVHKQGQRLLVQRGSEVLQDIPMIKVDRVVLMGKSVSITTPTLFALTNRKIGVYYLTGQGKFILRTVGEEHHHSRLRQAQIRASDDTVRSLSLARSIVQGKVHNQRVLVRRHSEGEPWARKALVQMDEMRRQVDASPNLDVLRGCEGLAAKQYFHLLRQIFRPPSDGRTWGFERRVYYPPTDPINALFSFGYTLLLNNLVSACQITGLDPDIGFFHAIDYNKPAMALDLEEEFRSVIVDSIVLAAINRPIFRLGDFEMGHPLRNKAGEASSQDVLSVPQAGVSPSKTTVPRPIYLKDSARRRFIDIYENRVNEQVIYPPSGERTTYRRIFELQAYAMARVILGETEHYMPFMIR